MSETVEWVILGKIPEELRSSSLGYVNMLSGEW